MFFHHRIRRGRFSLPYPYPYRFSSAPPSSSATCSFQTRRRSVVYLFIVQLPREENNSSTPPQAILSSTRALSSPTTAKSFPAVQRSIEESDTSHHTLDVLRTSTKGKVKAKSLWPSNALASTTSQASAPRTHNSPKERSKESYKKTAAASTHSFTNSGTFPLVRY